MSNAYTDAYQPKGSEGYQSPHLDWYAMAKTVEEAVRATSHWSRCGGVDGGESGVVMSVFPSPDSNGEVARCRGFAYSVRGNVATMAV